MLSTTKKHIMRQEDIHVVTANCNRKSEVVPISLQENGESSDTASHPKKSKNYRINFSRHILHDYDLSLLDCCLLGIIDGLSDETGYCFASNRYLAGELKIQVRRLQQGIDSLEKKGLLKRHFVGFQRRLFPQKTAATPCTSVHPPMHSHAPPHAQPCTPPCTSVHTYIKEYIKDDLKVDLKKKISKSQEPAKAKKYLEFCESDFDFSGKWGQHAKSALEAWVRYKTELGSPCLKATYQLLIDKYAENPRLFKQLSDRAREREWKGLNDNLPFEDGKNTATGGFKAHTCATTTDENIKFLEANYGKVDVIGFANALEYDQAKLEANGFSRSSLVFKPD